MKKLLLSISLTLIATTSFGQITDWSFDFDTPYQLWRFSFDTASNPNCSWQIGHPAKTVFTSAHSIPNAIVTDTLNTVPANDTSIFYMKHDRGMLPFHVFRLHFWFQMDGGSTNKGMIEVSPDTGNTWINLLADDTTYHFSWMSPKPTLTGSTSGWQSFDLDMMEWGSAYPGWGGTSFPIYITADTVLFRFTYITDSSSAPRDGWILDDFYLEDWAEGIPKIQNDNLISISPNPTSDELRIHRTKVSDISRIQILNYIGKVIYENTNFIEETFDTRYLSNGIYVLKYSDTKCHSIKRFVVQH